METKVKDLTVEEARSDYKEGKVKGLEEIF